ncbi:PepSY domain-containing protein [Elioraea sp.]|uniref:PepSY domain-containing protein n=1 Tax=Elioraea sp. TaxID=2185103 RepID=UPI0025B91560|nr:PepSY domain-containing protein [Elioraea sp.]
MPPEPTLSCPFSLRSAAAAQNGTMLLRRHLLALALALAAMPVAAQPRRERDHDRARRALENGEIRPLSELLAAIEARYDGRVIETELERDHGRWIYEFRLLPPSGRLFQLEVDAATGEVIATKGPVRLRPR